MHDEGDPVANTTRPTRRAVTLVVVAIALVIVAGGLVFWNGYRNNQYEDKAVRAWCDLQTKLDDVNTEATRQDQSNENKPYDVDFTATRDKAQASKDEVDGQVEIWKMKRAPGRFREFNGKFVDLLAKSSAVFQLIIDNCSDWSEKKMYDLGVKISGLRTAQNNTFNAWPAGRKQLVPPDKKIFSMVRVAFNATRLRRKRAEEARKQAEAEAAERMRVENQRLAGFHDASVQEMRRILSEYTAARDYFNTMMEAGVRDVAVFEKQTIAGRREMIRRLNSLYLPNSYYEETRTLFVSGIEDAIEAIHIKCVTGNGYSAAASRAARKIRQVQSRLG